MSFGEIFNRLVIFFGRAKFLGEFFWVEELMIIRAGRILQAFDERIQLRRVRQWDTDGQVHGLTGIKGC